MVMERQLKFEDIRPDLEKYLNEINKNRHPLVFILDNLINKRNIAGIFRLADAARIAHVYLYQSSTPSDSFKVKRISRSTSEFIPHTYLSKIGDLRVLQDDYRFVGLEMTTQSIPYYRFKSKEPIALLIGNEQRGLSQELLDLCERCLHIPMMGRNTSMNVSMATGIVTYGILNKMGRLPK